MLFNVLDEIRGDRSSCGLLVVKRFLSGKVFNILFYLWRRLIFLVGILMYFKVEFTCFYIIKSIWCYNVCVRGWCLGVVFCENVF